jgi:uncharacterized membrane protein YhfC
VNGLLVLSFLVAVIVDFGFPIALGVWLVRRYGLRWDVFGFGAVVFLLSQLVTRIPLIQVVTSVVGRNELTATPARTLAWVAVLALTAGIFEEGGRWLGYRWFFRPERRTWSNALLYGTGHEATESMVLVGLSAFSSLVVYLGLNLLSPDLVASFFPNAADLRATFAGLQGWEPLLGGLERIFSMAFQISAAVLVLQAFLRHNPWWVGLAIGWHALTDFTAVLAQIGTRGLGPLGLVITEGVVLLSALISLAIIRALRPANPTAPVTADVVPAPPTEPPVIPYDLDPQPRA